MDNATFNKLFKTHGDVIITYTSPVSNKQKYLVATKDFNNKYISGKPKPSRLYDGRELVFAWDADAYRQVDPSSVVSVQPLSRALNNG